MSIPLSGPPKPGSGPSENFFGPSSTGGPAKNVYTSLVLAWNTYIYIPCPDYQLDSDSVLVWKG